MENKYYRQDGGILRRGFWYKVGPEGEKIEVADSVVPRKQKMSDTFNNICSIVWMISMIAIFAIAAEGFISLWWLILTPVLPVVLMIALHIYFEVPLNYNEGE